MSALAWVIMGWHGIGAWENKDVDGYEVGEAWTFESGVWVGCGNPYWMLEIMAKVIGSDVALGLIMFLTIAVSLKQNVLDNDEDSWRDMGWETSDLRPNSLE